MFNITDLIYRVPNYLSDVECNLLIAEYESRSSESDLEKCYDSNTGIDTYSTFNRILLNEGTLFYDILFRKTEKAINEYIKYLDSFGSFHIPAIKQSMLYSHMYRLLKYEVGSKIHPHTDHEPHIYGSITFNLNDDYTGGVFKFFNGKYEVNLGKGEMMIWPADYFWVHEVTPVKTGARYSTNSFLLSLPEEIRTNSMNNIDEMMSMYYSTNNKQIQKKYLIE